MRYFINLMKKISNNKLMKNTKKERNINKKTMRGKGFLSSYKAPQETPTPLGSATSGQPCQAQLLNKDGTQARRGIECTDGTICQTSSGKKINSSMKPNFYWGQKDVTGNNMGTCEDPSKVKGSVARSVSAVKNTIQGTANASMRLNELGKMCGFIPDIQKTQSGLTFNKNLWRNLKRNMAILSSIPSNQLETLLNTPQSQSDYKNLSERLQKHGINLDANDFSDNNTNPQAVSGLPQGWKSDTDPQSGDTYYINESNGQTQWEFPTTAAAAGRKRKNNSKKLKRNKSKRSKRNYSRTIN